jgi:hypothetical protein
LITIVESRHLTGVFSSSCSFLSKTTSRGPSKVPFSSSCDWLRIGLFVSKVCRGSSKNECFSIERSENKII